MTFSFVRGKFPLFLNLTLFLLSAARSSYTNPTTGSKFQIKVGWIDTEQPPAHNGIPGIPEKRKVDPDDMEDAEQETLELAKSLRTLKFLTSATEDRLKAKIQNSPWIQVESEVQRERVESKARFLHKLGVMLATVGIFMTAGMAVILREKLLLTEGNSKKEQRQRNRRLNWAAAIVLSLGSTMVILGTPWLCRHEKQEVEQMEAIIFQEAPITTRVDQILQEPLEDAQIQSYQRTLEQLQQISWGDRATKGNEPKALFDRPATPTENPSDQSKSGSPAGDQLGGKEVETELRSEKELTTSGGSGSDKEIQLREEVSNSLEKPLKVLESVVSATENLLPQFIEKSNLDLPRQHELRRWEETSKLLDRVQLLFMIPCLFACFVTAWLEGDKERLEKEGKEETSRARRWRLSFSMILLSLFGILLLLFICSIYFDHRIDDLTTVANEQFRTDLLSSVKDSEEHMDKLERILQINNYNNEAPLSQGEDKGISLDPPPLIELQERGHEVMENLSDGVLLPQIRAIRDRLGNLGGILTRLEGKVVRNKICKGFSFD